MALDVLPVYVGYDPREDTSYRVCKHSIIRHSTIPLHVVPLKRWALEWPGQGGVFTRQWESREGQRVDLIDGKPFSTEFSFTRFLVPVLQQYDGWALFCDCDFLFTADIAELVSLRDDRFAVQVVKHGTLSEEGIKMDGCKQDSYPRKNWSSLVLWNCSHPSNRNLTRQAVNTEPGRWLHGFHWLKDEEIGDLPVGWNWLVDVYKGQGDIKALHYTLGTPEMPAYEDCSFSDLWWKEKARL